MATQPLLFDVAHPLHPRDPSVAAADAPRLTGQNAAILERLKSGPETNLTLARISLKYTSRLSDLRKHGHRIRCDRLGGGVCLYTLEK